MLHLLHHIRNAVRAMHFDRAGLLVHSELVPLHMEGLIGERQVLDGPVLTESVVIEVAGVEPSADVQTRECSPGL